MKPLIHYREFPAAEYDVVARLALIGSVNSAPFKGRPARSLRLTLEADLVDGLWLERGRLEFDPIGWQPLAVSGVGVVMIPAFSECDFNEAGLLIVPEDGEE